MSLYLRYISLIIISLSLFISCEREFDPVTTYDGPQLVVEGYISYSPGALTLPPYVILTKSIEYGRSLGQDVLNELFINDATVTISDGTNTAQLQELCVSDLAALPTFLQDAIANAIGIPTDAINGNGLDICVYADLLGVLGASGITPTPGGQYDLTVVAEGFDTITATTTIPNPVAIDSLYYVDHPQYPSNDTLIELYGNFTDPANESNYYRLFSQRNTEAMFPASSRGSGGSVTDDAIFNGQEFQFNISRGQDPFGDFDFDTFGYFWRGDTITIRSASIDYSHYRFWQTIENNTGGQGPFGTYTRVESNVSSGLGIWGGISYIDSQIIVPE